MKRDEFLKGLGLAGVATVLPFNSTKAESLLEKTTDGGGACTLIPSETAGPFPLDLTENSYYLRQDIRETQTGVQLNLKLKIIGADNCLPMKNLRVNVWHCSKEGIYSGYNNNMNQGDANAKHLRGYQFTDANGLVEFVTIFPGWYNGRIAHMHFQVYVSSAYAAVSQLTFDITAKNKLYTDNPSLYPKGADPTQLSNDNIFSDGYTQQLATLTKNTTTGGYDAYLEVTIKGSGVTGLGHIEKETAKVFEIGQNYPNPYQDQSIVAVKLKEVSDVRLELWSLDGKKVATVFEEKNKGIGEWEIKINPSALGLANGNYIYQFTATNAKGTFALPKMMTFMH